MESTNHGITGNSLQPVADTFKASDLDIEMAKTLAEKPDVNHLAFGTVFTDHMLVIHWTLSGGWERPRIQPMQNFSLHPALSALQYSVQVFEGLKAFRGVDNKIRLFRPMMNMDRMLKSAVRAALPTFDQTELLECIKKLVELEKEWVPYTKDGSLYIRPTFIGTEEHLGVKVPTKALLYVILCPVASYFSTGKINDVSLWANPKYVRAWKGGTGDCKLGGNYGCSLYAQSEAAKVGCQQVLWLYDDDEKITEAGTMNLFLYWINEHGEEELATPPLDGIILPGVIRQSILDLTRKWNKFKVADRLLTMEQLIKGVNEGRVKEMFGTGTACTLCPVGRILYKGENLHIPTLESGGKLVRELADSLANIQHGREESDWTCVVV
ncbi:branched-chain-amino-acid aminotransferase, cytosolic-like isoform X2 [Mobula hypostoma]|uniref:branched-chain-amino-acid aminotransferase, cytosolic-like isoform X2 n=1 Tax=Mobula hypostoma TaxID=723540 RepID=UPI002FC3B1DA